MTHDSELMDRIWEVVGPTMYLSREHWESCWDGWTIEGHELDGALAYATLINGPEFHFVVLREHNRGTPGIIRSHLKPLLERYGHVVTRTPKNETRQLRFNRAVGFRETGEDEFFLHLRLEAEGSRWLR